MVIYWDASPIIALLVGEPAAARYRRFENERIVTWWGTSLECVSAIARRNAKAQGQRSWQKVIVGWK